MAERNPAWFANQFRFEARPNNVVLLSQLRITRLHLRFLLKGLGPKEELAQQASLNVNRCLQTAHKQTLF